MRPVIDIPIGTRFGWLTVVAPERSGWLCQCACGKQVVREGGRLRQNRIKSCGCKADFYKKTNANARIRNGRITSSLARSIGEDDDEV